MKASVVEHRHDVKQKWVSVVIERLVVEKQLGEQAQILGVALVFAAVDLEECYVPFTVDLVAGRMA